MPGGLFLSTNSHVKAHSLHITQVISIYFFIKCYAFIALLTIGTCPTTVRSQSQHQPSAALRAGSVPRTSSGHIYDEVLAKQLLYFAAGAYSTDPGPCINKARLSSPEYQQQQPKTGWTVLSTSNEVCDFLESTCSFYTIRSDERREIVIVFRGTKTKAQLFLEGWRSTQPGVDFYGIGKVHKYFADALNVFWKQVQRILSDPATAAYKVTFTGHSLGGALASLASIRAVLDGLRTPTQVVLYTFGQPRIGCAKFAFKHDQLVPHSFRVVHRRDIVPHLPPCSKTGMQDMLNGDGLTIKPCNPDSPKSKAYHHGTEIWYENGMGSGTVPKVCLGQPRNEDIKCSDSVVFDPQKYKKYIFDHRNYFNQRIPHFGKRGCAGGLRGGTTAAGEEPNSATNTNSNGKAANGETSDENGVEGTAAGGQQTENKRLVGLEESENDGDCGDRNDTGKNKKKPDSVGPELGQVLLNGATHLIKKVLDERK